MRKVPALAITILLLTAGCADYVGSESKQAEQFEDVDFSNTSQVDSLFEHHHQELANTSSYTANATYHRNGSIHRYERISVVRSEKTARIVDRYFSSGDVQERIVSGDEFREHGPWPNAVQLPIPSFVTGFQFEQVEQTGDAISYKANGVNPDAPIAEAESASGKLVLNNDGIITHLSFTIEYEAGHELESRSYEYDVEEIDGAKMNETG